MNTTDPSRRSLFVAAAGTAAAVALLPFKRALANALAINPAQVQGPEAATLTFTKKAPPEWLMAFWKEIDHKTWGKGFDCFAEDATARLGVGEWNGREAIRSNLRAFIDTGFTAHHEVVEYWDGGSLKVFRGIVTMTPDDHGKPVVHPVMTHFFYMDERDATKVRSWIGSVGPIAF